jgi:PhnB protein
MALINPYIHFNGNAMEAFTFYRTVFGGEFEKLMYYKDLSGAGYTIAESDANRIMHIALPIGETNKLMGSDVLEIMGKVTENDNRNTIYIMAESLEKADQLFKGLTQDGNIEMPISEGPFGAYFGMLTDKYGVQWMVQFEPAHADALQE